MYDAGVDIVFDPRKSAENELRRDLPFSRVSEFEWATALVVADIRYDYPELRYLAHGLISKRLHTVVFTPVATGVRVISFRKSNRREVRNYAKVQS